MNVARIILGVLLVSLPAVGAVHGEEEQPAEASWQAPEPSAVRELAMRWLAEQKADAAVVEKAKTLWPPEAESAEATQLLARLGVTFALVDPRARALVERCARPSGRPDREATAWLLDETVPPVTPNLRLLYARWLLHGELFDEAHEYLAGLATEDVVDPASLLFCQGVVAHQLLHREEGLKALDALLARSDEAPRRYLALARLMREELDGLKEDSLDHIARRMGDIRRRLDLGRAGPKVRKIEDGVIESLDKLIKKLEEQQKKSQCAGSNSIQSNSPAPDSRILGGRGPGEVTQKKLGSKSGWGDLPPKQREAALQQIGREFPSHYRDVIEQYFRKLATEGEQER